MEKSTRAFALAVLVVAFGLLLSSSANPQQFASSKAPDPQPPAPCAAPPAPQPTPSVYHLTYSTPEQHDQIEHRKELISLVNDTFADEEKGIFDRKKYDRIKTIAAKLKNNAARPLPSPTTRYRPL